MKNGGINMICEKILGNLSQEQYAGCQVDYVEIEWHEAFKKIHLKKSSCGNEIRVRLDNWVLTRGIREGDILYQEGDYVAAVHIPECDCLVIKVAEGHLQQAFKVCYEIGNKHAALFYGAGPQEFITPYQAPTLDMLQKIHGVSVKRAMVKLDFDKSIASAIHNHTH